MLSAIIMSTLTYTVDRNIRDVTGHPRSYAEAKKTKYLIAKSLLYAFPSSRIKWSSKFSLEIYSMEEKQLKKSSEQPVLKIKQR